MSDPSRSPKSAGPKPCREAAARSSVAVPPRRVTRHRRAGRSVLSAAERIEAWSGDPNFMTSLARGIAVIRAFTQQKRRLTIAQLSQRTGIPRAAVRRCLYTLAELGYVNVEEGT